MQRSVRFCCVTVVVCCHLLYWCIDLYVIRNVALNGQQYKNEIFRLIVVFYATSTEFIAVDDNYRPRYTRFVEDFHFEEEIIWIDVSVLTGYGLNNISILNHIPTNQDILWRRFTHQIIPYKTFHELENAFLELLEEILRFHMIMDSMPVICSMIPGVRGNPFFFYK